MNVSLLGKEWIKIANNLRLDVVCPFLLLLPSGKEIVCDVLLRNFGALKGMIIISDYDKITGYTDEILEEGYGYSVMDEPTKNECYNQDVTIGVLKDWGWTGNPDDMPNWLKDANLKNDQYTKAGEL